MGGRFSREKGKRGERKARQLLLPLFPEAERSAAQFRGGDKAADLENTGIFHVEVKSGKRPNVRSALEQAIRDKPEDKVGLVIVLDDRKPPFVVLDAGEFIALLVAYDSLVRKLVRGTVSPDNGSPEQ